MQNFNSLATTAQWLTTWSNVSSFPESGQFVGVRGVGIGDTDIECSVRFAHDYAADYAWTFSGMTHLARGFSSTNDQNVIRRENLVSVAVTAEGLLEGIATNG
jgi:hypothetical protein